MGVLTPRPSIVRANFEERYESEGPGRMAGEASLSAAMPCRQFCALYCEGDMPVLRLK